MTNVNPAIPGQPKALSANEHNAMARAVNYVNANVERDNTHINNERNNIYIMVKALDFLRPGTVVQLGNPIVDITSGTSGAFPHAPTAYRSWMTVGMTVNTNLLANFPACYASSPIIDNTESSTYGQDAGRGVFGVTKDAILKGSAGLGQVAGIAACRVALSSLDDVIAYVSTSNDTGIDGALRGCLAGRSGFEIFSKPASLPNPDVSKYTWCYVRIGSFVSPYATRLRGKLDANMDVSDTSVLVKDVIPFDALLPTTFKGNTITAYNQMAMEGAEDYYVDLSYSWYLDRWELTGVQC